MDQQPIERGGAAELPLTAYDDLESIGFRSRTPTSSDAATLRFVRAVLRARARRAKHFSSRLFADPAWDMLLELYAAELAQMKLGTSKLCDAIGAPIATGLRWIDVLMKEGLVYRRADPLDGRRVFVQLTPKGWEAMGEYVAGVAGSIYAI